MAVLGNLEVSTASGWFGPGSALGTVDRCRIAPRQSDLEENRLSREYIAINNVSKTPHTELSSGGNEAWAAAGTRTLHDYSTQVVMFNSALPHPYNNI